MDKLFYYLTRYVQSFSEILWFLAREREPDQELKQLVHDKMDQNGIRRDILKKTNQTTCES